jgi:CRISPR-associated protein Cst2
MSKSRNLFCTVLTHAAPSSNYRGESELNRTVIQKIAKGEHEYAVISPESIRNALREILAIKELPMNRNRLLDEEQLAVQLKDYPDSTIYADDYLFGYMVAEKAAAAEMRSRNRPTKRDSILRMNLAVALNPYSFDATLHQSPMVAGSSPWKTASALLHREVSYTAYQFPFAINLNDCQGEKPRHWAKALLAAIGELSNVAGGHARSYFEMAPESLVARLTSSLVCGFDTYGFQPDGSFPDLSRINTNDLPGTEFVVAGALARTMGEAEKKALAGEGVRFFDSPQAALRQLADDGLKG